MKTRLAFKDANDSLVALEIEVATEESHGKKTVELKDAPANFKVLSISGSTANSSGQCVDDIAPASKSQERLIEIWKTYHLNDMQAGTTKQAAVLKKHPAKDYEAAKSTLAQNNLLYDNNYQYGSAWLLLELPENLEEELQGLIAEIGKEEVAKDDAKHSELQDAMGEVTLMDYVYNKPKESYEPITLSKAVGDDWPRKLALAYALEKSWKGLEHDIKSTDSTTSYTADGLDYWVMTEEEAYEACEEDLKSEDFWGMAVQAGKTDLGREDWIEHVIKTDGKGHLLNLYDGVELLADVYGVRYHIYRR